MTPRAALQLIRDFIEAELGNRRSSLLPDNDPYIVEAKRALVALDIIDDELEPA